MEMKKLKLIFLTSEGKRHIFYPQVNSDKITDKEIQKIIQQLLIVDKSQAKNENHLFATLEKAVWIDKQSTILFRRYKNGIIYGR